jgi:hypothetical protein
MGQSAGRRSVEVFDRKGVNRLIIVGAPVLLGAGLAMLLTAEAWSRGPWLAALTLMTLPLMTVGWLSLVTRRRRRQPALVITPAGVRINMLLAAVPWIPYEQFGGLEIERRVIGGRTYAWIRVQLVNKSTLLANLSWPHRLLLLLEGGRVRVPASNLDHSPDELASVIRDVVMTRRQGDGATVQP